MRDGAHGPLSRQESMRSSSLSARRDGWPQGRIDAALALARTIYDGRFDLFGIASVMQFADAIGPLSGDKLRCNVVPRMNET